MKGISFHPNRLTVILLAGALWAAGSLADEGPASTLSPPQRTGPSLPGQAPVVLVTDGAPKVTVVIPDERGRDVFISGNKLGQEDVNELAAREWVEHIRRISGATLPVVRAKDFSGGPAVYLGDSAASRKAGFAADDTLPPDGFAVTVKDGSVAIIGPDREKYFVTGPNGQKVHEPSIQSCGTLFGVYDVLERFMGVRWYWPADDLGTIAPKTTTLSVPAVRYADWPVYGIREVYPAGKDPAHWADVGPHPQLFYKRWRIGQGSPYWVNHSYTGWGKCYADTHPEYFLLRPDGQRESTYMGGHLCFSNPDVLQQEIENFKSFYATGNLDPWNNWSVWPHASFIPIMPNDCMASCVCPGCQAVNALRKDKNFEGSNSELVHGYWVKVADQMAKLWPEKYLMICGYGSYVLPPETIAQYPDNVIAELCMQVGMVMLKEPAKRVYWQKIIDAYVAKTGGRPIMIWSYSNLPQMSTRAPINAPNVMIRFRKDNLGKINAEFTDHEAGKNRTYALDHLNLYFWFKSKWNPGLDVRAVLDEYYRLCYGPAEPAMKTFYDLLIDRWENVSWDLPGEYTPFPIEKLYQETYPKAIRDRLAACLQQAAEQAPPGSDYAARVAYVTAGHQGFFAEGDAFEKIGNGREARVAPGTPTLDGKLDDPCWRGEGVRLVDTVTGEPTPDEARVWLAHDDQALYLAVKVMDPDVRNLQAKQTRHDDALWEDDGVEFFLCPTDNLESYFQFIVNTEGVVFDGFKDPAGLYSATRNFHLESKTLKRADGWDIEIKVPLADLGVARFAPGTVRRGNVIQNGHGHWTARGKMMSPSLGQSNHNTRFFGTLTFE
jgi:hypothetical protein